MKKDTSFARALGTELKRQRLRKNISQEKLAFLSGLHPTYISLVENGKKNITIVALKQICKNLTISLENFFRKLRA